MPQLTKLIDIQDFQHPELLPHLKVAGDFDGAAFGVDDMHISPDDGSWRSAMSMLAFDRTGVTRRPGVMIAGLGAGADPLAFLLARENAIVFALDRYLDTTPLSSRAPADMMLAPQSYSELSYPSGNIIPIHADPRAPGLPDGFFHAAYAHGVFEFLGDDETIAVAAEQMGRILKPGGIATITTEFLLAAPAEAGWPHHSWRAFTETEIQDCIVEPSGLMLVDAPYSLRPSAETFAGKRILMDFAEGNGDFASVLAARDMRPNLIIYHQGFLLCSIHMTLKKPDNSKTTGATPGSKQVAEAAAADARDAATALMAALRTDRRRPAALPDFPADPAEELRRLKSSRSWRLTAPLRSAANAMRRTPIIRSVLAGQRALKAKLRKQR